MPKAKHVGFFGVALPWDRIERKKSREPRLRLPANSACLLLGFGAVVEVIHTVLLPAIL
jgi:hypothetical protein